MWGAVADESKLALFDVLLDRVERLFLRDLEKSYMINIVLNKILGSEVGDIVASDSDANNTASSPPSLR